LLNLVVCLPELLFDEDELCDGVSDLGLPAALGRLSQGTLGLVNEFESLCEHWKVEEAKYLLKLGGNLLD